MSRLDRIAEELRNGSEDEPITVLKEKNEVTTAVDKRLKCKCDLCNRLAAPGKEYCTGNCKTLQSHINAWQSKRK